MRLVAAQDWLKRYSAADLKGDALAGVIVTLMLIPQSLAYALLAGLPAEAGLYASVLPLVAYAIFGSSRTLAVGPVAIVSLMTASAIAGLSISDPSEMMGAAIVLAAFVGLLLAISGLLRLGFLATLLSHPVINGFISASAILIAASQLGPILGISGGGENIIERLARLIGGLGDTHVPTLIMGGAALMALLWARKGLAGLLKKMGVSDQLADLMARGAPAVVVVLCTAITYVFGLGGTGGIAVVGDIPSGLPPITLPSLDPGLWGNLASAAVLIALVGFVESISVAQSLAARRRQQIDPNQELLGLGGANIAAAFTGGYPVTGGFARSAVSFAAGAQTPLAGVITAGLIALVALWLTPLFAFLPKAVLAATIIAAVTSLVDFGSIWRIWRYSRPDAIAELGTVLFVLFVGIEAGIAVGVALSFILYIARTGQPHIAEVGRVPGTEHYRNILRHKVVTHPKVVAFRVDESLYFINARHLEDSILHMVAGKDEVKDVVMICSAINVIDGSALEMLRALNDRLKEAGIRFHLAEVKGPVMDRLQKTAFLKALTGNVYLSTHEALEELAKDEAAPEDYSI